jgi:uncharacterized protein YktB (UPF0637 family)
MASPLFTSKEFEVFKIPDFQGRMAALRERVRPKLAEFGEALRPSLAKVVGGDLFAHVAKHARRTVNPPDDTWVAFGPDKRGYKKDVHFKVAVSRNCLRFLFEVGPEYQQKTRWASLWTKKAAELAPALKKARGLGWFKSEHDEEPATLLKDLSPEELRQLSQELTRTRDGQFVLGRLVSREEATDWSREAIHKAALSTFELLAPLFRMR